MRSSKCLILMSTAYLVRNLEMLGYMLERQEQKVDSNMHQLPVTQQTPTIFV